MLEALITLLVVVIVLALIYWAVHKLGASFGLPAPVIAIIDVVLVVIFVLVLLSTFGLFDRLRAL